MLKRGQQRTSAGGAAILVIILAAIFVLYILFLPPGERADLLGENETLNGDNTTISGFDRVLLDENIGRLDYLKFSYRTHDMPSFRIFSEIKGTSIQSASSIYVENSLGKDRFYNLSFNMDKELTKNVLLSFNVQDSRGRLEISLNGREIFNGELSEGTPTPINLQREFLEDESILEFKVSSPGLFFWRPNEYELSNVRVTGDVLDKSESISRQYFYISDVEKKNLDAIKLRFYPECDVSDVGTLKIYLNGDEVFSGIADCGIYNTMFMDPGSVFTDRNELRFVAEDGTYLFDRVSVRTELEELVYPVYYFELDEEVFASDETLKQDFNVTLFMRFVDRTDKKLEYNINGRKKYVDTDELTFEASLDPYVFLDTNSLELIPKSVVDIAVLKVVLDEK